MKTPWNAGARFDLGGRSMGKMEYLLGGALTVIILGSVGLSIYMMMGGKENTASQPITHYYCEKCQKEFEFDFRKQFENTQDPRAARPMNPMMYDPRFGEMGIDCTQCGQKACAFRMNRCEKCGNYWPTTAEERTPRTAGNKRICPKCNTDQFEYLKEKYSK
jgi:hypothetical protein